MASINDSQCVLVLGATAGIGRSLALSILYLPSKPTVVVSGRRQDRLDELTKEHGHDGRLEGIKIDIDTDRATLKRTVEDVVAKYPKVRLSVITFGYLNFQPPPAGYHHILGGHSAPF
jgi:NADP-dependent 3-hydroxy acid dehydrogenase YdfG